MQRFHRRVRGTVYAWLALAVMAAPFAAPARAEEAPAEEGRRVPILWEVQTKPTIYLFGTIHVADSRVTTHPSVVKEALARSQALYTELDFAKLNPVELAKFMMIPDGKTLKDVAPEATYAKFEKVVQRYEIGPMQVMQWQRFKPWLPATQISMEINKKRKAEEAAKAAAAKPEGEGEGSAEPAQADTMANQPLDLRLYLGARQAGKLVGGLELPEEQFAVFEKLSMERQVQMLDEVLDEILKLDAPSDGGEGNGKGGDGKPAEDPVEGLIRMYLKGDVDGFHDMMAESLGEDSDLTEFMADLLDRRNVVMVRRMLEAAEKHPDKPMFVAVGAGHYGGPMAIQRLLRKTGFRVRPLRTVEDMDKRWPKVGAEASSRAAPAGANPCPPRPRCRRFLFGRRY